MARQRKFKCSKCGRSFSMAAHLGRHKSTMHASKKAKATKKKKRRAVATREVRGTRSDLGGILASLKAHRNHLVDQRNEIDTQMQAIDAVMAALGAGAAKPVVARRSRGTGPLAGSLKDYIGRVLRGRTRGVSVKDITVAVRKAGYKSKNKTLDTSVGNALADMKNVVRVTRGVYRLK